MCRAASVDVTTGLVILRINQAIRGYVGKWIGDAVLGIAKGGLFTSDASSKVVGVVKCLINIELISRDCDEAYLQLC